MRLVLAAIFLVLLVTPAAASRDRMALGESIGVAVIKPAQPSSAGVGVGRVGAEQRAVATPSTDRVSITESLNTTK